MTLTPRIECRTDRAYTSLSDFEAVVTKNESAEAIVFETEGRLLSSNHQPLPSTEIRYHLVYRLSPAAIEIIATAIGSTMPKAPVELIVPVISRRAEPLQQDHGLVRITKTAGSLSVTTDAPGGFAVIPTDRTFNLVPGFECTPLTVHMDLHKEFRVRIAVI
jgi:hypothetical protein